MRGTDSNEASIFQGSQFTVQRVKSYVPLVKSRQVLDPVIREFGLGVSVAALRAQVSASSPIDTALIQVSASDAEPQQAQLIANAVSRQFGKTVEELETSPSDKSSQIRMTLTSPADLPGGPSFPKVYLNFVLGAVAGLASGHGHRRSSGTSWTAG